MQADRGSFDHRRYEFRESDAWDFARQVGIQVKTRGRELTFQYCPYCHGGQGKERDKFSINLDTGQYKCMRASCGAHGNMLLLARDFGFKLVEEPPPKQYKTFKTPEKPIESKQAAIQYLEKRGISANIVKQYEVTTNNGKDNILAFPFYDESGKLVFVKYRKTDFVKGKDKNKEWCQPGGKPILFGMKQCEKEGALIITEGQIDSLSVAQAGYKNAVSVPTGALGFTWVPNCWDFMQRYSEIIVFGDHENGKITLLDEIKRRFGGKVKHVREDDYRGCKDANEILQKYGAEQIKRCIDNAVFAPVDCVVNVATVEAINPHDIEKLRTGIGVLDNLLKGGLPFGYYHIITGKRGDGKSTFASQLVAEALDQGYTTFAYSGEMTVSHFKAWIDYQLAGENKIRETNDGRWYISKADRERMEGWYNGRLYAYDAEMETENKVDLLTTIDEVIRRYGVRVVLLDNLMTAVDLDADARANKYDIQGQFAKRLSEIAKRYNVLILLVAHKRKSGAGDYEMDPNDDISGSSYVSNLAGSIIGYARPSKAQAKECPEGARMLTVTKNRLFGDVNYAGWPVMFWKRSKRIGNDIAEMRKAYGWEKDDDGFMDVDEREIPW